MICDFVIDATVGINEASVDVPFAYEQVYNLQGLRVSTPVKGGIYIVNGKKIVVK